LGVDDHGLNKIDRELMGALAHTFKGKPVGVNTLAAAIAEESSTVEDIYEPYLMQLGFIERTPRGRLLTEEGLKHITNYK